MFYFLGNKYIFGLKDIFVKNLFFENYHKRQIPANFFDKHFNSKDELMIMLLVVGGELASRLPKLFNINFFSAYLYKKPNGWV